MTPPPPPKQEKTMTIINLVVYLLYYPYINSDDTVHPQINTAKLIHIKNNPKAKCQVMWQVPSTLKAGQTPRGTSCLR